MLILAFSVSLVSCSIANNTLTAGENSSDGCVGNQTKSPPKPDHRLDSQAAPRSSGKRNLEGTESTRHPLVLERRRGEQTVAVRYSRGNERRRRSLLKTSSSHPDCSDTSALCNSADSLGMCLFASQRASQHCSHSFLLLVHPGDTLDLRRAR